MKKFLVALGALALLGGCAQIQSVTGFTYANPVQAATQPDTRVLAAYGLVTIALEEAADIAENPATPTPVVEYLARYSPVLKEAADLTQIAAIEYREAMQVYEAARDAGLPEQQALLSTALARGIHAVNMVGLLRTQLDEFNSAFRRAGASRTTLNQADAILATAQGGFLVETPQ